MVTTLVRDYPRRAGGYSSYNRQATRSQSARRALLADEKRSELPDATPQKLPYWRGCNLPVASRGRRRELFDERDFADVADLGFKFGPGSESGGEPSPQEHGDDNRGHRNRYRRQLPSDAWLALFPGLQDKLSPVPKLLFSFSTMGQQAEEDLPILSLQGLRGQPGSD